MSIKQKRQFLNIWLTEESVKRLDELRLENMDLSKVAIIHTKILATTIPEKAIGARALAIAGILKANAFAQIAMINGSRKLKPADRRELFEKIRNDATEIKKVLEELFPFYKNFE